MSTQTKTTYRFGDFYMDLAERLLLHKGEVVPLTAKVFDTLLLLMENAGHLVEKNELMDRLWPNSFVDESSLTQNISLLRKALGEGQNGQKFIETVPRRGYRFVAKVSVVNGEVAIHNRHPSEPRTEPSLENAPESVETKEPGSTTGSEPKSGTQRLPFLKRYRVPIAAAILVLLTASAIFWIWQRQSHVKLAFQQRDWVLITAFDNRTGEPLFDGTLEYALERELSNSDFVNVIPRVRIEDALRLMTKPTDTKVDAAIGKEICLRDGAIRALLAGSTEKLGSLYVLTASLVDPASGQVVASSSEEAKGEEQIGFAVRQLSNWAREALGEKLASIRQSSEAMEKVTTPSLRALQLYTQAEVLLKQGKSPVAEQILREALVEDPEFASAHMMLAWSLFNQKKPDSEWKPLTERALELSERVSERERYFIQGSYYSIRRQDDKSAPIYEALLQRYPDHYWGRNKLTMVYERLRRFPELCLHSIQLADQRPNDFTSQLDAANFNNENAQREIGLQYAKRANSLITPEVTSRYPYAVAWIQTFLISEHFMRGDPETALIELDRLAQTVDGRSGRERDAFAHFVCWGYARFGKLKAADEFAQKVRADDNHYFDLAVLALIKNDKRSLKKNMLEHLQYSRNKGRPDAAPLLIRAELLVEAEKLLANPALKNEGFLKVCQGELALTRGQIAKAIPL